MRYVGGCVGSKLMPLRPKAGWNARTDETALTAKIGEFTYTV